MLLRIDPDREIDRQPHRFDLVAAIGLLVVEIGLVLKRVCLQLAGVERRVGSDIVLELDDLDVETVFGGDRFDGLKNLRVGTGRDADLDGFGMGLIDDDRGDGDRSKENAKQHHWSRKMEGGTWFHQRLAKGWP